VRYYAPLNLLDDIAGGTLLAGVVPLARMLRARYKGHNAGAVTVVAGATTVLTLDCGTVVTGDVIRVSAYALFTKGATAGYAYLKLLKDSGAATVEFFDGLSEAAHYRDTVVASGNVTIPITAVVEVTLGGTLTLKLTGYSAGSNSTVAIAGAQMYVEVLTGV
jgi:hypothetical protein